MTRFTVTVEDNGVQTALQALADRGGDMRSVLTALGGEITDRAKHRFETSTGPDGTPWKPNSATTLMMLADRLVAHRDRKGARSYAYSKQGGLLNGKGLQRVGNKKPLIGESETLRKQILPSVSGNALTVLSTPFYAAIQQFGGQAGRGHKVTIPARPFLPVRLDGTLYPQEGELVLKSLNDFLMGRI